MSGMVIHTHDKDWEVIDFFKLHQMKIFNLNVRFFREFGEGQYTFYTLKDDITGEKKRYACLISKRVKGAMA